MTKIYYKRKYPPLINIELKRNTIILDENQNILCINKYLNKSFSATIEFSYVGIWYNEKNQDIKIVF